jgi:hypothetical protein
MTDTERLVFRLGYLRAMREAIALVSKLCKEPEGFDSVKFYREVMRLQEVQKYEQIENSGQSASDR